MDKETALYWQEIIRKAEQGDEEAAEIYLSEETRRCEKMLPTIRGEIMHALNPPKLDWDGLPTMVCEWP